MFDSWIEFRRQAARRLLSCKCGGKYFHEQRNRKDSFKNTESWTMCIRNDEKTKDPDRIYLEGCWEQDYSVILVIYNKVLCFNTCVVDGCVPILEEVNVAEMQLKWRVTQLVRVLPFEINILYTTTWHKRWKDYRFCFWYSIHSVNQSNSIYHFRYQRP